MEPPENTHEDSSHRRKVVVWVGMSSQGLISPVFYFNETANSERYLHVLQTDFLPQLRANGLPLQTQ
jgi:hypothetical protein